MVEGPPRQLPPKKEVALSLLEGPSMYIHLDPRRQGVSVPKWFMGQPQLVLQVGLNMAIAIPDLNVDDDGVSCTLSFNRSPFFCVIPWGAVYALVGEDGQGMVWPNEVPPEFANQPARSERPVKAARKRPKLAAVDASEAEPPAEAAREEHAPLRNVARPAPAPVDEAPLSSGEARTEVSEGAGSAPKKPKRELPPYLRIIK